jgi:hypothetical protein
MTAIFNSEKGIGSFGVNEERARFVIDPTSRCHNIQSTDRWVD